VQARGYGRGDQRGWPPGLAHSPSQRDLLPLLADVHHVARCLLLTWPEHTRRISTGGPSTAWSSSGTWSTRALAGSCLVEAPDAEAASRVHREAHGVIADEISQVSESS
jgi:hypothetical protein